MSTEVKGKTQTGGYPSATIMTVYMVYLSPRCFAKIRRQHCPLMDGENKAHWFVFQALRCSLMEQSTDRGFQTWNNVDISLRP